MQFWHCPGIPGQPRLPGRPLSDPQLSVKAESGPLDTCAPEVRLDDLRRLPDAALHAEVPRARHLRILPAEPGGRVAYPPPLRPGAVVAAGVADAPAIRPRPVGVGAGGQRSVEGVDHARDG